MNNDKLRASIERAIDKYNTTGSTALESRSEDVRLIDHLIAELTPVFPAPEADKPIPADIDKIIEDMTQAYLCWPLPHSVCADFCATRQGPDRVGTNLLSYAEAKKMFSELAKPAIVGFAKDRIHALELENTAAWTENEKLLRPPAPVDDKALAQAIKVLEKRNAFVGPEEILTGPIDTVIAALRVVRKEVADLRKQLAEANDQLGLQSRAAKTWSESAQAAYARAEKSSAALAEANAERDRLEKENTQLSESEQRLREAMQAELKENQKLRKGTTLFDAEMFLVQQVRRLNTALAAAPQQSPAGEGEVSGV